MKIRNGFVSNSSSSSFIINYPQKPLRLKDVEAYFGGFNDDIPDYLKDVMTYVLWKNQFVSDFSELDDKVLYACEYADKEASERRNLCPEHKAYADYDCTECSHWRKRSEAEYIDSLINQAYSDERIETLQSFKKRQGRVREIEISSYDNDQGLSFEEAYAIREYTERLFKSHKDILEERD